MREQLSADMKAALKAGEKTRLGTIRLIIAAIKSAEIEAETSGKGKLADADLVAVLAKMVKQRRDSIQQYKAGGRAELAAQEEAEIGVIEHYLPKQLSEGEAKAAVESAIKESGAASIKDMGKVMGVLKAKYAGQIDMGKAGAMIKAALGAKG